MIPSRVSPKDGYRSLVFDAARLITTYDATEVLAGIARDYINARARQKLAASRPDARRTLEVLAESARCLAAAIQQMPCDKRGLIFRSLSHLKDSARQGALGATEIGESLLELASAYWLYDGCDWEDLNPRVIVNRLNRAAEDLAAKLCNLPMACEWAFYDLQQYALLIEPTWEDEQACGLFAQRLAAFADVAAELMKTDRGRRSDHVQMLAVGALKVEFQKTGRNVSHNCKTGRLYSGHAGSEFGEFVHAFFAQVEQDAALRYGLTDAIAHACWSSRRVRRNALIDEAREKRFQTVARLFGKAGVSIFSPPA